MMRLAAIDCGTNSIRLLIADVDQATDELSDVVRTMRIVRLGEGIDSTGEFSQGALTRTFAACDEYASFLSEHGNPPLRFVATSATRDAGNRAEFVAGVKADSGFHLMSSPARRRRNSHFSVRYGACRRAF